MLVLHLVGMCIFPSFPKVGPLPRIGPLITLSAVRQKDFPDYLYSSGEHFVTQSCRVPAVIHYSRIVPVSSIISETSFSVARGSVKAGRKPCRASFTSSFCLLHHILNPTHSLRKPGGNKKHRKRGECRNHYVQFINH